MQQLIVACVLYYVHEEGAGMTVSSASALSLHQRQPESGLDFEVGEATYVATKTVLEASTRRLDRGSSRPAI